MVNPKKLFCDYFYYLSVLRYPVTHWKGPFKKLNSFNWRFTKVSIFTFLVALLQTTSLIAFARKMWRSVAPSSFCVTFQVTHRVSRKRNYSNFSKAEFCQCQVSQNQGGNNQRKFFFSGFGNRLSGFQLWEPRLRWEGRGVGFVSCHGHQKTVNNFETGA